MAKIGNEAKLILKLAKEKADREKSQQMRVCGPDHTRRDAFIRGLDFYERALHQIVREIEEGK